MGSRGSRSANRIKGLMSVTELRAVRGMNDIVPPDSARWRMLESTIVDVLNRYGYREVRLPIVESTQVFARSIGDTTDIVQKEMYTFADRNGDSLTLRPEGTAGCVRAVLENGLLQQSVQRLYYVGPMFRHERPQKGRYRQFHQVGVEAFGMAGPDIDAELILITARLWRTLGLQHLRLELNTLGSAAEREAYRTLLLEYFSAHSSELDADSQQRLTRNPLRILDSKNPDMKAVIAGAPRFGSCLGEESTAEFASVCAVLDTAGVPYTVNPHLVRGLDYYSKTVFEWITDELGAQGTVCAGGRYDGLVEQMGGRPTPAIGFALGLERLLGLLPNSPSAADADLYVIGAEPAQRAPALALAEALRDALPTVKVLCHCGPESLKSQMKRADRSGAQWTVILGADELATGDVTLKPLRGQGDQRRISQGDLMTEVRGLFTVSSNIF
jgi:histidyl-tRNA synthetase